MRNLFGFPCGRVGTYEHTLSTDYTLNSRLFLPLQPPMGFTPSPALHWGHTVVSRVLAQTHRTDDDGGLVVRYPSARSHSRALSSQVPRHDEDRKDNDKDKEEEQKKRETQKNEEEKSRAVGVDSKASENTPYHGGLAAALEWIQTVGCRMTFPHMSTVNARA